MVSTELVTRLSQAIARAEGFYETDPAKIPTLPQRANNPGDMTDDGDVGCGLILSAGVGAARITIYPNASAGWQALYKKVTRMLEGESHVYRLYMTIAEVGWKYAESWQWGVNVAADLGVDTSTTLQDLVNQDQASIT